MPKQYPASNTHENSTKASMLNSHLGVTPYVQLYSVKPASDTLLNYYFITPFYYNGVYII